MSRSARRWSSRARPLGVAFSLAAHASILLALLSTWRYQPRPPDPPPMTVDLIGAPTPEPAASVQPASTKPPPVHNIARPALAPPDLEPLPADDAPMVVAELGEADLAGAGTAESGGAGGVCNMARLVQDGLRKDPLVRTAVADAHSAAGARAGKAILVWNGDWLRNLGQDGKGLAAVREAILWEVGFAPPACRAQPVQGLVVLSLSDSPGGPRLALGGGAWRWSDLLSLRPVSG